MYPKVLFIGNFLSASRGTRGASENIAEKFIDLGWQVLTTSSHPSRIRRFLDIIITIVRHRSEFNVVNIEVYSGMAFMWAEVASTLLCWLRKPFILTLHGGGLPLFAQQSSKRMRRLLSIANAVTTPSHYIQQAFHPLRSDILYLPNGVNMQHYSFHLRSAPSANIVWLRAFHEIYNPSMAVEVVARLVKQFPQIHLDMIGPDKADGTYQKVVEKIAEYGIESNISIIGPIQNHEVPECLQRYDLFINTTHLESFGVAVMEAGAVGLPIVTTSVGELPYLWLNDKEALLVPPNDAGAMAKAITRILTEPGLAEQLSHNARQKAQQYDWETILPIWESLIMRVLDDA